MIKTIVLYGRRNTGFFALTFLLSQGFKVKVISDDKDILWLADVCRCEVIDFDNLGEFSLFLCVHGTHIIPEETLKKGVFVNVHPCLSLGYKGHNPTKRFIENKDTEASVDSHFMVPEVDAGEVIHSERFHTGVVESHAAFYNQALKYYYITLEQTLKKLRL